MFWLWIQYQTQDQQYWVRYQHYWLNIEYKIKDIVYDTNNIEYIINNINNACLPICFFKTGIFSYFGYKNVFTFVIEGLSPVCVCVIIWSYISGWMLSTPVRVQKTSETQWQKALESRDRIENQATWTRRVLKVVDLGWRCFLHERNLEKERGFCSNVWSGMGSWSPANLTGQVGRARVDIWRDRCDRRSRRNLVNCVNI